MTNGFCYYLCALKFEQICPYLLFLKRNAYHKTEGFSVLNIQRSAIKTTDGE